MPFCHAIFPAVYISKRLYEFHLLSLPLATGEIFTQPLIEKSDLQSAYISSSDLERDEHGEDEEADERREDLEGGEAEPPQQLVQLVIRSGVIGFHLRKGYSNIVDILVSRSAFIESLPLVTVPLNKTEICKVEVNSEIALISER